MVRRDTTWATRIIVWSAALIVCGLAIMAAQHVRHYQLFSVQSDSMRPYVDAGDAAIVKKQNNGIKAGDVVTYRSVFRPSVFNTHRVVSIDYVRGIAITKGDNVMATDNMVPVKNIVGTVTGTLPLAGYVVDALRHPLGLIALIYLPAVSIVVGEIRRLGRSYVASRHYILYR